VLQPAEFTFYCATAMRFRASHEVLQARPQPSKVVPSVCPWSPNLLGSDPGSSDFAGVVFTGFAGQFWLESPVAAVASTTTATFPEITDRGPRITRSALRQVGPPGLGTQRQASFLVALLFRGGVSISLGSISPCRASCQDTQI